MATQFSVLNDNVRMQFAMRYGEAVVVYQSLRQLWLLQCPSSMEQVLQSCEIVLQIPCNSTDREVLKKHWLGRWFGVLYLFHLFLKLSFS